VSSDKIELIRLLEEAKRREAEVLYLTVFDSFYRWQKDFVKATAEYHECCLCAANQIGKTYTGTDIDAMHLLGEYPEDWGGHEFDFAPMCWGLGFSMEKTRDLLQTAIFGKYLNGEFEGGLVPKARILGWESATGTPNSMRTVRVKHKYGESIMQFWSYSQGAHAIMGDVVDFIHVDEEPRDQTIRPQLLTRSINGDKGKGGRIIYTFTPENGKTELVTQFMEEPSENQFFMMKGWNDAPHMTEEKKERLLSQYPAYQRDMRSKGMPLMGAGLIYEVSEDYIKCDPFDVPMHWFVINGMDFGWDHPQAHIQMVWDRDADIFYIINAWKASKKQPYEAWHVVKPWAENVPTAWPNDGLQTEKGSARQQKDYYEEEGFYLLDDHAQWEDGGNGVWAGLVEINNLMKTGRLRVVSTLFEWFEEMRQYHTKTLPSGKSEIVKTKDDLLDATRYAYMMRRFAIRVCDLYPEVYESQIHHDDGRDKRVGY